MIEVDTTYSWQTLSCVAPKDYFASPQSRSQAHIELSTTCVDDPNSSKYILADTSISALVSAFSITGNTFWLQV